MSEKLSNQILKKLHQGVADADRGEDMYDALAMLASYIDIVKTAKEAEIEID